MRNFVFVLLAVISSIMSGCCSAQMSAPSPQPVVMRSSDTASVVSDQAPRRISEIFRSETVEESEKTLQIARLKFEMKIIHIREDMLDAMVEQLMQTNSMGPVDKAMSLMAGIRMLTEPLREDTNQTTSSAQ
jgi:hypothetical protein